MPKVVIIGRINVGKSSLFNRLTETGKALISPVEGTTRDYNIGEVRWRKKVFQIIDTGGVNIENLKNSIKALLPGKKNIQKIKTEIIEKEIIKQTKNALEEADLIMMVVDGKTGLMPEDKELALILKKLKKPLILACNKIDRQKFSDRIPEFYKLGLGQPWPVSAVNGSGTGDFLDVLIKLLKWQKGRPKKEISEKKIKVVMIGKPNVGKSSLVNKMIGQQRVIVSPIAQTTREPQDTEIIYKGEKIILIDTAGLRKKSKIERGLEKMATKKTAKMMKSADIVLFITEADRTLVRQDSHLAGLLKISGPGIIIVANKWDLISEKDNKIDVDIKKYYGQNFPYISFSPIIFISAKTGRNVEKIFDLILEVQKEREKEIPEQELREILKKLVKHHHPAKASGQKKPYIYAIKQTKNAPPEFTVFVGAKQSIHFSYLRFIENQIRQNFGFLGVPIIMKVKSLRD